MKILPRKTRPNKDVKRSGGETEGGSKIVFTYRNCLWSWSASFPRHPDYCLRVSDDIDALIYLGEKNLDNIDAAFDLNRMIRDP